MKKSRFSNEQIAFALQQASSGTLAEEVCREFGVGQQFVYRLKKSCGGMGVSELRQLTSREEEILDDERSTCMYAMKTFPALKSKEPTFFGLIREFRG